MALGAERSSILRVVLADGLRLSLMGIAIGLATALGLTGLIESQLYGVTPTDPTTFIAVAAVLLAVALIASYLTARRTTNVDPMQALRHE
jgi:ABC-type antimicrobial peptide transport system permease subunit